MFLHPRLLTIINPVDISGEVPSHILILVKCFPFLNAPAIYREDFIVAIVIYVSEI